MENIGTIVEHSVDDVKNYAATQIEIAKLELVEKFSMTVSGILSRIILILVSFVGLILLSGSVAILIGDLLNSYAAGFAITAGIFIALGIILFVMRQQLLTNPIIDSVIEEIYLPDEVKD